MYPVLSHVNDGTLRQKAISDMIPALAGESDRVGGSSFCKYGDMIIGRIEFEIAHRAGVTSLSAALQLGRATDSQPAAA